MRLTQELLISGVAAAALYATGQRVIGWAVALVSVIYHALVYARGDRLLKTANSGYGRANKPS